MTAKKEIVSMNVKKIIPWATGLAVFVTKEARALSWSDKDQVVMTAFRDENGDGIEIRRAPIKRK
ncbi:MAG: hypothetical protein ACP5NX_01305 [Candidatus Bilamarchaeaceae archaeon]